jgi:hypothetical protein
MDAGTPRQKQGEGPGFARLPVFRCDFALLVRKCDAEDRFRAGSALSPPAAKR